MFVWCDVIMPDNSVSCCADAEMSVRDGGSGNRRAQVKRVRVRTETLDQRARECVCGHSRSDCFSPIVNSNKIKKTKFYAI